jgi:hypothetical protein
MSQPIAVGTACRNTSCTLDGRCNAISLSLITVTGVGSALTSVGTIVPVVTTSSSRCIDFSSAKSAVASWSALTVTDTIPGAYPMYRARTVYVPGATSVILYRPSLSVIALREVRSMTTVAPGIAADVFASVTLPLTLPF